MIPEYYYAESIVISVSRETDGGQEHGIQMGRAAELRSLTTCLLITWTTQWLGKLGQGQI